MQLKINAGEPRLSLCRVFCPAQKFGQQVFLTRIGTGGVEGIPIKSNLRRDFTSPALVKEAVESIKPDWSNGYH